METYPKGVMRFLVKRGFLTQKEADQSGSKRTVVDALVQLKRDAGLLGASEAAMQRAISLIEKGKNVEAKRTVIADGLGLPEEALKTRLGPQGLLRYVADLQLVGAGEKATDPTVWRDVAKRGTDPVLADAVRESLGLPASAGVGKNAKSLLNGASDIALLGGDARSAKAWVGLGKLKSGRISLGQFVNVYNGGDDVGNQGHPAASAAAAGAQSGVSQGVREAAGAAPDVGHSRGTTSSAAGGGSAAPGAQSSSSQQQTGSESEMDAINIAFVEGGSAGKGGTYTGAVADAVVVVHNNDDGTFTATTYIMGSDGNPVGSAPETFTDADGDGHYDGDHGGQTDVVPPDGAYPAEKNDDGGYTFYLPSDDASAGDADPGASGSDTTATDDANDTPAEGSGGPSSPDAPDDSTTNPENDDVNSQARLYFLLATPMGAAVLRSWSAQLGQAEGGGYTDPADDGGSGGLFSGTAFYSSKVGRSQAPGVKAGKGDIDYTEEMAGAPIIDSRQLLSIELAAGGTLVDPDHYVQPARVPTGGIPVRPSVLLSGGAVRRTVNTTAAAGVRRQRFQDTR